MKATIAAKIEEAKANHQVKLARARARRMEKRIDTVAIMAQPDLVHKIQNEVILKGAYRGMTYGECLVRRIYRNMSGEDVLTPTQIASINTLWEFLHGTGEAGKEKAKQAKDAGSKVLIVAEALAKEVPFIQGELTDGNDSTPDTTTAPE